MNSTEQEENNVNVDSSIKQTASQFVNPLDLRDAKVDFSEQEYDDDDNAILSPEVLNYSTNSSSVEQEKEIKEVSSEVIHPKSLEEQECALTEEIERRVQLQLQMRAEAERQVQLARVKEEEYIALEERITTEVELRTKVDIKVEENKLVKQQLIEDKLEGGVKEKAVNETTLFRSGSQKCINAYDINTYDNLINSRRRRSTQENGQHKAAAAAQIVLDSGSDDEEKLEGSSRDGEVGYEDMLSDDATSQMSSSMVSSIRRGLAHNNGLFEYDNNPILAQEREVAAAAGFMDSVVKHYPFEEYDDEFSAEMQIRGITEEDLTRLRTSAVAMEDFVTVREEGRCGAPAVNDLQIPEHTHVALQMNFFRSAQHIVYLKKGPYNSHKIPVIPNREPNVNELSDIGHLVRHFSSATMQFETDLLLLDSDSDTDGSSSSVSIVSEEGTAHDAEHQAARRASLQRLHEQSTYAENGIDTPSDPDDVSKVGRSFAFPDPLHMWELTRGKRFNLPAAVLAATNPDVPTDKSNKNADAVKKQHDLNALRAQLTTTVGSSTYRIYTFEKLDVNAYRKPVPAVAMFNNGFVLHIEFKDITSPLRSIHGDVDPLFLTCNIYSLNATQTIKLSENFYVSVDTDRFFPHKPPGPYSNLKKFILFVPEEHRKSPLVMLVRVFRMATEDFETYYDMYNKPDRYQQKHVTPLMQETQQLAMQKEILQELGWCYFYINDRNGTGTLTTDDMVVEKLFRSYKVAQMSNLAQIILSPAQQSQLYVVPIKIIVQVKDVTEFETSFPNTGDTPLIEETESIINIRDTEKLGSTKQLYRHIMSPLLILSSGYFNGYSNVLYIRLYALKLNNFPAITKLPTTHRSFVVQVAIKDNDDSYNEEGLACVYGRTLTNGLFETSVFSPTVFQLREMEMDEEVKIELPPYLNRSHHVFFTYWAVNLKKGAASAGTSGGGGAPPRMIKLGHSVLPLLSEKGVVVTKDKIELGMIPTDTAAAWGPSYLSKSKELSSLGSSVITFCSAMRSSIHATGNTLGQTFDSMRQTLPYITKDDGVLWNTSGILQKNFINCDLSDTAFAVQFRAINTLYLPEILAFFPMLCSYHLSVIASPSSQVSLTARKVAFKSLVRAVHLVHAYDSTTKIQFRRVGMTPNKSITADTGTVVSRTAAASILYTFLSNCLLFTKQPFPLAQGVAEVWLSELEEVVALSSSGGGNPTPDQNTYNSRLSDLSWFFLDLMLRSFYMIAEQSKNRIIQHDYRGSSSAVGANMPQFDKSFYMLLKDVLITVIKKDIPMCGATIVVRVFLFIRQLLLGGNCGQVLALARAVLISINANTNDQNTPSYVQAALRVFTEGNDAYLYTLPNPHVSTQPQYMMQLLIEFLSPHLLNQSREVRSGAIYVLYNFVIRIVNNNRVGGYDIELIATSMYSFVLFVAQHWKEFNNLSTDPPTQKVKSPPVSTAGGFGISDRRCLLSLLMWIIFHGGMPSLKMFIRNLTAKEILNEKQKEVIAGLLQLISNAQVLFRYHKGTDKMDTTPMPDQLQDLQVWDSRFSTFTHIMGAQIALTLLKEAPKALRLVVFGSKNNTHIYPFFILLEGIVNINNSSLSLMCGATAIYQATVNLFPELISGKAAFIPGIILLVMRLMSFCAKHARYIATKTLFEIAFRYYVLCGNMGRMKSHMANSLVGVAESKGRDMSRAGSYILCGLEIVAGKLLHNKVTIDSDYIERFRDDGNMVSGSSGMKYDYTVPDMKMSVDRLLHHKLAQEINAVTNAAAEDNTAGAEISSTPVASVNVPPNVEFAALTDSMLLLFKSILRLKNDDAMRFKETKCAAYHQIVLSFLNQSAVTQGFQWLQRLHETHRSNEDHAEAALVTILSAALAFRITEVFYDVKGVNTKGARMPYTIFTHILWHDYVRIVPEIEMFIPLPAVYTMVKEMTVVSTENIFTIEGQILNLQNAADLLDKANYAELSISTALVAAKYAAAKCDYNIAATLHSSVSKLYSAINSTCMRRTQHRYYVLWARMEMEQPSEKAVPVSGGNDGGLVRPPESTNEESGTLVIMRKSKYLIESIKRIYKVPYNMDKVTFQQQAVQVIGAMLDNPQDVFLTDENTETASYQKPKKTRSISNGKGSSPFPEASSNKNRCLLTVQEVLPHFTEEEQAKLHPYQIKCNALDKTMFLDTFSAMSHIGIDKITKGAEAAVPGTRKMIKLVSQFQPNDQRLEQRVYKLDRAFPCTTTAIEVVSTLTHILDAFETATNVITGETLKLRDYPSNQHLINKLNSALTPFGIVPAGQYYKQVLLTLSQSNKVKSATEAFITTCKKRMDDCMAQGAMEKVPEICAQVLKAIADMECVMLIDGDDDK